MSVVVVIRDLRPPARFDGEPWTDARVEEALTSTGAWTAIDTLPLTPDPDPEHPASVDLTTDDGTLAAGWYRVVFVDAADDESPPTGPFLSATRADVTPTVDELAVLLWSRTEVDEGTATRTFGVDTVPTRAMVEVAIGNAVGELDDLAGIGQIPDRYRDEARRLAAIRAAGQILVSLDDPSTEDSRQLANYSAQWLQRSVAFARRIAVAGGAAGAAGIVSVPLVSSTAGVLPFPCELLP